MTQLDKTFNGSNSRILYKARVCVPEGLFGLVQCLWVGQEAYPSVEHLKGLPRTNTLAYYKGS
jgi:hypothetical protein